MLYAVDFRKKAREALSGRWGIAIGTTFVACLLGIETSSGSNVFSNRISREDVVEFWNSPVIIQLRPIIYTILAVIVCVALVQFLVSGAVSIGYCRFCLNLVDFREAGFDNLFSGFNIFWKAFGLRFMTGLYTFLWSLLLIIPGIIAAYSYSQASFIMAENPDMGIGEAIAYSKSMMKGNKWRLFCLEFSFLGWILLAVITLGIGMLWVNPYLFTAKAVFYREVSNTWKVQEFENTNEYSAYL